MGATSAGSPADHTPLPFMIGQTTPESLCPEPGLQCTEQTLPLVLTGWAHGRAARGGGRTGLAARGGSGGERGKTRARGSRGVVRPARSQQVAALPREQRGAGAARLSQRGPGKGTRAPRTQPRTGALPPVLATAPQARAALGEWPLLPPRGRCEPGRGRLVSPLSAAPHSPRFFLGDPSCPGLSPPGGWAQDWAEALARSHSVFGAQEHSPVHYPADDGGGQGPLCSLDSNHSHFILVEPGPPGGGDGSTELWLRLERHISEQRTSYGGEPSRRPRGAREDGPSVWAAEATRAPRARGRP